MTSAPLKPCAGTPDHCKNPLCWWENACQAQPAAEADTWGFYRSKAVYEPEDDKKAGWRLTVSIAVGFAALAVIVAAFLIAALGRV